ncbi:hypothetical protein ACHAWF_000277, partial [Thalassiosira exigua]
SSAVGIFDISTPTAAPHDYDVDGNLQLSPGKAPEALPPRAAFESSVARARFMTLAGHNPSRPAVRSLVVRSLFHYLDDGHGFILVVERRSYRHFAP